jgi:hypothetical protein
MWLFEFRMTRCLRRDLYKPSVAGGDSKLEEETTRNGPHQPGPLPH